MSEENVEIVRRVTEIAEESIPPRGDPGTGFDECVAQGFISPKLEWQGVQDEGSGWRDSTTSPDEGGSSSS
jgi:hypothetical protein